MPGIPNQDVVMGARDLREAPDRAVWLSASATAGCEANRHPHGRTNQRPHAPPSELLAEAE